jgi:uncharacterized protein
MKIVIAGFSGAFFAFGLVFSGMTDPKKVQSFLDFGGIATGRWDPSLAFVMGGALLVTLPGFSWLRARSSTRTAANSATLESISITSNDALSTNGIDARLILGASLFGIGWGLSGYCPGPAITSGVSAASSILIFLIAMVVAMVVTKLVLLKNLE